MMIYLASPYTSLGLNERALCFDVLAKVHNHLVRHHRALVVSPILQLAFLPHWEHPPITDSPQYLISDLKQLALCDAVFVYACRGRWRTSLGCYLEVAFAMYCSVVRPIQIGIFDVDDEGYVQDVSMLDENLSHLSTVMECRGESLRYRFLMSCAPYLPDKIDVDGAKYRNAHGADTYNASFETVDVMTNTQEEVHNDTMESSGVPNDDAASNSEGDKS